jgi:hypothetical protein
LMRWRVRSTWWNDVIKFDKSLSSNLMKWRFHLSSLMNRFRQVWWVILLKFDEMLRQAWRLIMNVARQIENKHTSLDNREWACVIRQKWDLTSQKNWRWDDQAWSRKWIISNNFCKEQMRIAFLKSHLTFRDKTQNTLSTYFRKQFVLAFIATVNLRCNLIRSCKRERLLRAKKFIIVMFFKKSNSQTKRLFSFIIVCFFRSTSTIQSFREVKRLNRLVLRDFYYTYQDFIAARQKDLELHSDYNFFFKLFSSVISNQFFRKFIFDSSSDTDLFDLEAREFSSISLKQSSSSSSLSSHHVRRKHQNDLFVRDNAIERFFRISNMTERNEKSVNFYESLTLRRNRECRINWLSLRHNHLNFNRFNHFREASQDQNK